MQTTKPFVPATQLEFLPEITDALFEAIIQSDQVGSTVTCWPIPQDADLDYLCYVDSIDDFVAVATQFAFVLEEGEGAEHYLGCDKNFVSLRRGNVNLLATHRLDFYEKFMAATSVAKKLNLLKKSDRIDLFQAVLYAKECKP